MNRAWKSLVSILVAAALLAGLQLALSTTGKAFYLTQLIMSAYYSIVVLGLCLVMGYCGQASLGHAAFFAIGGYTSAILTTKNLVAMESAMGIPLLQKVGILVSWKDLYGAEILAVSPWAGFLVAMAVTVAVSFLIGYPALRLKGHYLAMATLGFGLIIYRIILGSSMTGSADGITGVPPWKVADSLTICSSNTFRVANYYFAWGVTLAILFLLLNLVHSRIGRALRAIHDGELAANAMGVNTAGLKLQVFVLSAVLAAAAGSLFTHYTGGIGPSEAGAAKSVRYLVLVAAGGMASLWGALGVSTLLTFLSLRGCFGSFDHAVFGAILIAIVSWAPDGPLQPITAAWQRIASWFTCIREGKCPCSR